MGVTSQSLDAWKWDHSLEKITPLCDLRERHSEWQVDVQYWFDLMRRESQQPCIHSILASKLGLEDAFGLRSGGTTVAATRSSNLRGPQSRRSAPRLPLRCASSDSLRGAHTDAPDQSSDGMQSLPLSRRRQQSLNQQIRQRSSQYARPHIAPASSFMPPKTPGLSSTSSYREPPLPAHKLQCFSVACNGDLRVCVCLCGAY
ncbi:hypothetical protein PybrP1_002629 [[Pythium] brassicae (nom. inval.)]|nr:hypothetical protein PybrP1_002629 [[Pythium] brassicae (nom. inval.)]